MMKTKVITKSDLQQILSHLGLDRLMDELIDRLTLALARFDDSQTLIKKRDGFAYDQPHPGVLEWMPCMQSQGRVTLKMVAYNPKNPQLEQLPTILSSMSLYDARNGRLLCLVDGTLPTALRTGAASAIASRVLARADAQCLGMIGCGAQAVTQIHALSRIFDLSCIKVYDINSQNTESLNQRLAHLGIRVIPSPLHQLVESADILCTATSVEVQAGPIFADGRLKPWLHINAIGSDLPGKTELPLSVLKRAFVCPDFIEQARVEGECQQLDAADIDASLVDLVKQPEHYRAVQEQLSVFDSTGYAIEDQVVMELLYDYANSLNLGTELAIESYTEDVFDPYAVLKPQTQIKPDN
jgi:ornithine cyclodeaminase